jgi:hypothetical protein
MIWQYRSIPDPRWRLAACVLVMGTGKRWFPQWHPLRACQVLLSARLAMALMSYLVALPTPHTGRPG